MAYEIIETCIGCTACVKKCPADAITGLRNEVHIIDPELCIDCGACGAVCPPEAILDECWDAANAQIRQAIRLGTVYSVDGKYLPLPVLLMLEPPPGVRGSMPALQRVAR